jgi:hypothetical protein
LQFNIKTHTTEWSEFLKKKPVQRCACIETWEAPLEEWIMINTDAAFISDRGRGGWGAVGRDSDGDMVFAAAGAISHASDAFQNEASALLRGLLLAEQMGIGRVKMATDCLTLQNALTSTKYVLSHIGALLRQIKFMLNLSFIDFQVVYVSRSCNKPAHNLAAHGMTTRCGMSAPVQF